MNPEGIPTPFKHVPEEDWIQLLELAAQRGYWDIFEYIAKQKELDKAALSICLQEGKPNIVKTLVSHGIVNPSKAAIAAATHKNKELFAYAVNLSDALSKEYIAKHLKPGTDAFYHQVLRDDEGAHEKHGHIRK